MVPMGQMEQRKAHDGVKFWVNHVGSRFVDE